MAKRDGKRVADVVNSALKVFIERVYKGQIEGDTIQNKMEIFILRNDGEIKLSKNDVVGLEREVGAFTIENTGHLIFEKDIDKEAMKNIDSIIIHDGTVKVPRSIYPLFLVRSEIHGKVEKY